MMGIGLGLLPSMFIIKVTTSMRFQLLWLSFFTMGLAFVFCSSPVWDGSDT